jgi:hypothetical protein
MAWRDLLPAAPRDALYYVRELRPEDPRFADTFKQALNSLGPANPVADRSVALDILSELARRSEQAREAVLWAAANDPSWRVRLKARRLMKQLAGY